MNNVKRFAIALLLFAGAISGLHAMQGVATPEQKKALLALNRGEQKKRTEKTAIVKINEPQTKLENITTNPQVQEYLGVC